MLRPAYYCLLLLVIISRPAYYYGHLTVIPLWPIRVNAVTDFPNIIIRKGTQQECNARVKGSRG